MDQVAVRGVHLEDAEASLACPPRAVAEGRDDGRDVVGGHLARGRRVGGLRDGGGGDRLPAAIADRDRLRAPPQGRDTEALRPAVPDLDRRHGAVAGR